MRWPLAALAELEGEEHRRPAAASPAGCAAGWLLLR